MKEACYGQRTESCRYHRRVARHRRGSRQGVPRSQLPRGRNRALDEAVKRRDILAVPGDIADRKTAERAISEGMARFGRIDTLVNNAGIFIAKPFTQYTEADYAAILGVNVTGFFHMTQLAIAEMEKQRSGHVVQISTSLVDHASSAVPSVLASLTKGGLNAATKSLAIEYAKRGIRVNAVALGVIKSPMHPVETYAQLDLLHPVGHMGEISDVVDAILYLEFGQLRDGRDPSRRWRPERRPLIPLPGATKRETSAQISSGKGCLPWRIMMSAIGHHRCWRRTLTWASTTSRANCVRKRGTAKSTKARTFGTESRRSGVMIWTGNGGCSSDLSTIRSRPSRTCPAT